MSSDGRSARSTQPRTLFDKIWARHVVTTRADGAHLLYVDRHLVQDGSAQAFDILRARGLKVRSPSLAVASADHYVPTGSRQLADQLDDEKRAMAQALASDSAEHGISFYGIDHSRQGIVHVIGPEQGLSLPGTVMVCGDSHTSTHGAMGALAFGIGASEVAHVLATQTVWQKKPKRMRVLVNGVLPPGVFAKDIILALIGRIGAGGAVGHVIEYAGSTMRALSIEGRLTVCNMSIEAGARAGMVAPDDTTFEHLVRCVPAQMLSKWEHLVKDWRSLATDLDANFEQEVELDAQAIEPMVTWGNSPQDVAGIGARVPDPAAEPDAQRRAALTRTLDYMGLVPGATLAGTPVQHVFIGSCTNGRVEDFRAAAAVVRGRKVAPGVRAWAVPGSAAVRAQAEAEGLHRTLLDAGFEWRYAGCSMCLGTNGDTVPAGERSASTSNRNFQGRQGPGSRTHLLSPAMAAAAAVTGCLTDVRPLLQGRLP